MFRRIPGMGLIAALASMLLITTVAVPSVGANQGAGHGPSPLCSTTGAPLFSLDLTGTWKFTTGDDLAWLAPSFNDSAWENRVVPDNWNLTAQANYDGFAWYRLTFNLPARPAGLPDSAIIASMGYIDDADATYLNGTLIGSTGAFPPNFDSTWEVPRQYYPPDGLLNWGGSNVFAVRMYDGSGGGGWYQGPIGLFSKASLRALSGLVTTPATNHQIALACQTLERQHDALANVSGRFGRELALAKYMSTLDAGFLHQGDDLSRRSSEVSGMLHTYAWVELVDAQTEVVVDTQGRIVVDTIRSWVGHLKNGTTSVIYPPTRQFLYIDPRNGQELGDHARMFRDSFVSTAMGKSVNFDVYLPPSYTTTTNRRFPVVYMLHGYNGSNIEWEARHMDTIMDGLIKNSGIAESIVIFPDGDNGWWVNSSVGNFRDMLVKELVPLVDKVYRTIPDRDHRGITGVSMGGQASFNLGLEHPELFSSIASHIGALAWPPYAGTPADIAANAHFNPLMMVNAMTTAQLLAHTYYFDAGLQDDYGFNNAAIAMDAALTAKNVPHVWQLGPGRHADAFWVPKLVDSFGLHTAQFLAHPYRQAREPKHQPGAHYVWP
jgi:enterochelin esterase-like enzyme